MNAYKLGVIILSLLGTALAADQKPSADSGLQTYVDSTYKVMLRFPAGLTPDPEIYLDRPYFQTEPHPNVAVRNFQLLLLGGGEDGPPEQSCKDEAKHKLQPFGPKPIIRRTRVDGQSACFVSASTPRNEVGALWDAAVLIKYPTPVEMDGEGWDLLEVFGDPEYVRSIARTLRFISPGHESPPFLLEITGSSGTSGKATGTWKPGAPIFLTVTMTNNTGQILQIPFATPGTDYQLNMSDAKINNGKWESRFDEEHLQMKREREGALAATQKEITLKPHETCRRTIEVGSLLMPDSRPGKYSLEMQMKLPAELGTGLVRSNTIPITVAE